MLRALLAEVGKHHLDRVECVGRIEVECIENIVDAVGSERYAHTRHARHSEYAGKIVISAAAGDCAYCNITSLYLDYCSGIVIEAACERHIEVELGI